MESRKRPLADDGKRPVSIGGKRNRYLDSGGHGGSARVTQLVHFLGSPVNSSSLSQTQELAKRLSAELPSALPTNCTLKATRAWLDQWMQQITILKSRKVAGNLGDSADFWKRIRVKKYRNDDISRLYDPILRMEFSHYILRAHLYHVTIGELFYR
ncbi:hypothetical protein CCR75_007194 [Bremia lactucae]|uniref:Uncharacterized protein n=1 Tax=Bremia lactucae TaxID=4779 RepID=A0A976FFL6_BRELC|nr:hypothetical protein CCR75_007194 [Bremia lactucae]